MTDIRLEALARDLADAWSNASTVAAPTSVASTLSTADAYAVQEMVIAERMGAGRSRAGWKLGLTSADPPATPIVGTLLDDMVVESGSELVLGSMVGPMVEAEIVVHIGESIDRPVTVDELYAGPHRIGPGIEVIDYRTVDSTGPIDWIADNSTVAYAVVGDPVPIDRADPPSIHGRLFAGSDLLAEGSGRKVMGDPLAAVAWLSGHLAERGLSLDEGHVILTGSITGHHPVPGEARSEFTADFGDLGVVGVVFRT